MIRTTLLTILILALAAYAWKDWYNALCGLIVLTAFIDHPDMPRSLFGIQGMNPWNLLLIIIFAAWIVQRRNEGVAWDMPRHMNVLFLLYLAVLFVGFFRMIADSAEVREFAYLAGRGVPSNATLVNNYLINSIKWVVPGIMMFDGCRSKEKLIIGLVSVLVLYLCIGLLVIKVMPLSAAYDGDILRKKGTKIDDWMGYHRVDIAAMMAGAFWAVFSTKALFKRRIFDIGVFSLCCAILLALALTGGRTGYATWIFVGMIILSFRWRKFLLLAPVLVFAVISFLPGTYERITQGFNIDAEERYIESLPYYGDQDPDLNSITSDRNIAWPLVLDKIADKPVIGYGRLAMKRTGIATYLWLELGKDFPHPHNAYLELMIDNGLIGTLIVLCLFFILLLYSLSVYRDSRSPLFIVTGAVSLSLLSAHMIASLGSQTFYPREGFVGLVCAVFLMLRLYKQRVSIPRAL